MTEQPLIFKPRESTLKKISFILFNVFLNSIKDVGDVKEVDITKLGQILGKNTAINLKKQVGQDFEKLRVKENKRKGQISLMDFNK